MFLRTLGGLALEGSDFSRVKPLLLLTYLCLEGRQERRHLAELFWPDAADALNSLSRALTQLRQGAPEAAQADELRVWAQLPSDAALIRAAQERKDAGEVVRLYRGVFLEGVFLEGWSSELEDWVYETRERLASAVQSAVLERAEEAAAQGRFEEGAEQVAAALALRGAAPLEPEALARSYALLRAGEHHLAETVRREAAGYGVALTLSPEEARNRLQTGFVGRDAEVARLAALGPGRWGWLWGAPGIGKTTLLRRLPGTYLPARSGLPYATLEPLLGETVHAGEEAMLRHLAAIPGTWLLDGWEWMDAESRALLRRLRDLRPQAGVVITARSSPAFRTDLDLMLGPLPEDALARFPRAWEETGGIPSLVGAFLRGDPLEAALQSRLRALSDPAPQVYLALLLLESPDLPLARRALGLGARQMATALEQLAQAGLVEASGRVRAEHAARHLLDAQPLEGAATALALARHLEPRAAFPHFARGRLLWEDADETAVRQSYLAWAEELLRRGAAARAAEVLQDAPAAPEVKLLRARALERAGRFRDALEVLGEERGSDPSRLALRGTLLWRLGQPGAARAAAEAALEGDLEARAEALNTLGHLARAEGDFQAALTFTRRAAALWQSLGRGERHADALNNLAVTLTLAGEDAQGVFEEALAACADNPAAQASVFLNLGWMHERAGRSGAAETAYQQAVGGAQHAETTAARAHNNLGALYYRQGRKGAAQAAYQRALAAAQRAGERRLLGLIMANLAELTEDLDAWHEALHVLKQAGHHDAAEQCRVGLPAAHPFRRAVAP